MPAPFSHPYHNMTHIPGGSFLMGSLESDPEASGDEFPQHLVTLSAFLMDQYQVNQEFWDRIMGKNTNLSQSSGARKPVTMVSWYDAASFCNRLSIFNELACCYFADNEFKLPFGSVKVMEDEDVHDIYWNTKANGFRLPTEAEWEYAARGGTESEIELQYSGGDNLGVLGWFELNSQKEPQEVGLLAPNALGLYDMSGNVGEMCWDWYVHYSVGKKSNPIGPEIGYGRVIRGGGWDNIAYSCRLAYRTRAGLTSYYFDRGFRLTRTLTK